MRDTQQKDEVEFITTYDTVDDNAGRNIGDILPCYAYGRETTVPSHIGQKDR